MFIRSTGLAQPVESFTQGARLRATLQQIDQEQQAQTFNQTMKVIDTVQRSREAKARIAMQQQEIDLRARESENRMRLQQESMDLRRASITARGGSATAGQPQFTPAGVYPGSSTPAETTAVEPNIPATPTPLEPPAASESAGTPTGGNFMAAAPAGDAEQISPLDMSGAGQPEGMPMLAIPKVDDVIDQNPMIAAPAQDGGAGSDRIWGTLEKPGVTSSGKGYRTEYAVVNGVRSTRTVNEKTGTETKWTAAPSTKTGATGSAEVEDPTAGIYKNADGVLVKKVGDGEIPVETITQRSKAGSVTMRQSKRVEPSRMKMNGDGTGIYTDESGAEIPVKAKRFSNSNGKWTVSYETPDGSELKQSASEKDAEKAKRMTDQGFTIKEGAIGSNGEFTFKGSKISEEGAKAGTIGDLTSKWTAKAKEWRDEMLAVIDNPTTEEKAARIFNKKPTDIVPDKNGHVADPITPEQYSKVTDKQWKDAYHSLREEAATSIAKRINALDGVPVEKLKAMLLHALPADENGGISGDEYLPSKEAILFPTTADQSSAPEPAPAAKPAPASIATPKPAPTSTAPKQSFLDLIIPKIQAKRAS